MATSAELIKKYSGDKFVDKNYVGRATAKFMEDITNNIHGSDIPVQLHEEIIHNMKRTIVSNDNEIEAHIYFNGPYRESITNPSVKASMAAVYNDINIYDKKYDPYDRDTWISYYGYDRRRHKSSYPSNPKEHSGKIYMILNQCYGKGSLFIEKAIENFINLYPEAKVTLHKPIK